MRGAPAGAQPEAQDAARRETQPVVRRLAVDQKPAAATRLVGRARAVAAALLADDEHEPDARFALAPEAIGGRHLRRENPFRIAGAAPIEAIALDTALGRTAARSRRASRTPRQG